MKTLQKIVGLSLVGLASLVSCRNPEPIEGSVEMEGRYICKGRIDENDPRGRISLRENKEGKTYCIGTKVVSKSGKAAYFVQIPDNSERNESKDGKGCSMDGFLLDAAGNIMHEQVEKLKQEWIDKKEERYQLLQKCEKLLEEKYNRDF